MNHTPLLRRSWNRLCDALYRVFDPFVDRLVHLEPLPAWTNRHLLAFAGGVWAFAISLSWWADSLTFVVTALSILAVWFVAIFIRVGSSHG